MYKIFLSKEAVKFLVNLDRENEKAIRDRIKKLEKNIYGQ